MVVGVGWGLGEGGKPGKRRVPRGAKREFDRADLGLEYAERVDAGTDATGNDSVCSGPGFKSWLGRLGGFGATGGDDEGGRALSIAREGGNRDGCAMKISKSNQPNHQPSPGP
jgi:hypothetical protein